MTPSRFVLLRFVMLGLGLWLNLSVTPAYAVFAEGATLTGTTNMATGADGTNTCTMDDYYDSLGVSENSGAYGTCNSIGCCGKYQFCPSTLAGLGYNRNEFVNNPAQQEEAIRRFTQNNYNTLVAGGAAAYIGQTINGVTVTWSGLLGAAHLGGAGGALRMLRTNGGYDPSDGHTRLSDYMAKFAGFDTAAGAGTGTCDSNITPPPGGFMTEQLTCDPAIRQKIRDQVNAHAALRNDALRQDVPPPPSIAQIANTPCMSKELQKVTNGFSNMSSGLGGMMPTDIFSGGGPVSGILNNFFRSGFKSISDAAAFVPQMLNFQTQASAVLGNLLGGLGGASGFNDELCGMMIDMVVKFVQCQVPMQLPQLGNLTGSLNINLDDLLPKDLGCAGNAARDTLYEAAQKGVNSQSGQGLSFGKSGSLQAQ